MSAENLQDVFEFFNKLKQFINDNGVITTMLVATAAILYNTAPLYMPYLLMLRFGSRNQSSFTNENQTDDSKSKVEQEKIKQDDVMETDTVDNGNQGSSSQSKKNQKEKEKKRDDVSTTEFHNCDVGMSCTGDTTFNKEITMNFTRSK